MKIESQQIPHIYRNRFLRDGAASSAVNISQSGSGGGSNVTTTPFLPVNLWGNYFDDTEDINGDLSGVGSITADGSIFTSSDVICSTLLANDVSANTVTTNYIDTNSLDADSANILQAVINQLQSTNITTEFLTVTKQAHFFSLIIDELKHVGGQIILSPANAVIDYVTQLQNGDYRCYFRAKDKNGKQITNNFVTNDQVICQTFNVATGTSYNVSNKYYWRLCMGTGRTTIVLDGEETECHYIDLSDTVRDGRSVPEAGDNIAQLGYIASGNNNRKNAIILSAYQSIDSGLTAPSIAQYKGIVSFGLSPYRYTYFAGNGNSIRGDLKITTGEDVSSLINNVSSGLTDVSTLINNVSTYVSDVSANLAQLSVTVDAISSSVGHIDVRVGARNLLRGTKTLDTTYCSQYYNATVTPNAKDGFTSISKSVNNLSEDVDVLQWTGQITPIADEYYTLSFYARGSGQIYTFFYPDCVASGKSNTGQTTTSSDGRLQTTLTSSWKRYTYTWQTKTNVSGAKHVLCARLPRNTVGSVELCGVQFEHGNIATDWSPAPEDIDGQFYTVNQSISSIVQNASSIESRVTTIENGNYVSESTLLQTANQIRAQINTSLGSTGIDITNQLITLSAENVSINGNLNLYDNNNAGFTIYDENNTPRVNIQSDAIDSLANIDNDTYTHYTLSKSQTTEWWDLTTDYQSLYLVQYKTLYLDKFSVNFYGAGSVYPTAYTTTLEVIITNTSGYSKTYTISTTKQDTYGNYKNMTDKVRWAAPTAGTYRVQFRCSNSTVLSSATTLYLNVNARFQTSALTQTYIGRDGFLTKQGPYKMIYMSETELELKHGFNGIRFADADNNLRNNSAMTVVAGVSGSGPTYKPLWLPFYNFTPMFNVGVGTTPYLFVYQFIGNINASRWAFQINAQRDSGICYVRSSAVDSNLNTQESWIILPPETFTDTNTGNTVALPDGYTITIINDTGGPLYVVPYSTTEHDVKIVDSNQNDNYYCELNGTQTNDTYIYIGSYAGGRHWRALHDTQ